jgi:tol-pal system protein YbgF
MGFGALACAVAGLALGCVTPAEHRKLEKRVIDMERGGGSGSAGEPTRLADLAARLDELESELRRVNGRLEVTEHGVEQALAEARAARSDAAAGAAGAPGPEPSPAAGAGGASSAELDAYRDARAAWSNGEADACIDRFRNFLQTYPASGYAESASYWMADCYFKRGDYKTAVLRFDDVVARYPTGERAPDALYRQGEALLRLGPGYGKAASKAFERVVQEYPNSARAPEARKQLELLKTG